MKLLGNTLVKSGMKLIMDRFQSFLASSQCWETVTSSPRRPEAVTPQSLLSTQPCHPLICALSLWLSFSILPVNGSTWSATFPIREESVTVIQKWRRRSRDPACWMAPHAAGGMNECVSYFCCCCYCCDQTRDQSSLKMGLVLLHLTVRKARNRAWDSCYSVPTKEVRLGF